MINAATYLSQTLCQEKENKQKKKHTVFHFYDTLEKDKSNSE